MDPILNSPTWITLLKRHYIFEIIKTVKKEKKERGSTDGWDGDGRDDMSGGGGSQVGRGRGRGGAAHFR